MRVSRMWIGAGAAGAVLALSPAVAWAGGTPAGGPSNVRVSPSQVHQGATLSVTASGCTSGGTVTSAVFPAVHLPAGATTTATARVDNSATPGAARLTVTCSGRSANANFTVLRGAATQGGLGGSHSPGTAEMVLGASMAAGSAAAGAFYLVRRHNHGRVRA